MPAYDYDCATCGTRFEVVHGVHADPPTTCPACGSDEDQEGHQRARGPLQGIRLGQEGTARHGVTQLVPVGRGRRVGRRRVGRQQVDRRRVGRRRVDRRRIGFGRVRGRQGGFRRAVEAGQDDQVDRSRDRRHHRLTDMAAPTDWITLREAAEILAAANVHFTPATIGGWARAGRLQSLKLGGRRFVRRGEVRALVAAPRRVRLEDIQPVLFEDLGS